jgi:hypothetical protein
MKNFTVNFLQYGYLGYFNHSDFQIIKDRKFETVFKYNKLILEPVYFKVKELRLVKYTKRSLEDAELLLRI